MAVLFDTLRASQELREAGFEPDKADAMVTAFAGAMFGNVATKDDVIAVKDDLAVLKGDLIALEEKIEQRITLRLYTVAGAVAAFLTAVMAIATAILLAAG